MPAIIHNININSKHTNGSNDTAGPEDARFTSAGERGQTYIYSMARELPR